MTIKIRITFYDTREGYDLTYRVKETEEYLSRLTGLVVRIETETK